MEWVDIHQAQLHINQKATIGGVYLALNNASPVSTSPYIYNCTSFGNKRITVLDGSVIRNAVCYSILILQS